MDERKSNIRLVKTGGRKVTRNTTEYDKANRSVKEKNSTGKKRTMSSLEHKVRYQKRQKQRRRCFI